MRGAVPTAAPPRLAPMSPIAFGPGYEPGLYAYHPALGFVSFEPLLDGVAGTEQTIRVMRQLVDEALRDPRFIRFATDLIRNVPAWDDYAEARAIWEWFRTHIRFTKDPVNKEKLYPPTELLEIGAGDCDDISMALAAALMAVGYPARFVTVAANNQAPDEFSHVYVEGQVNGQWIPMDAARFDSEFGLEPPVYTRKRWWSLVDDEYGDLRGTKVWAEPGSTVHLHLKGLGDYPRFRSHLGAYGKVRTLGQEEDGWTERIATTGTAISDIIRASEGQPTSPYEAQIVASSQNRPFDPWSSFRTQYTPGYGVPYSGYSSGVYAPGISASISWPWLIGGGIIAIWLVHRMTR